MFAFFVNFIYFKVLFSLLYVEQDIKFPLSLDIFDLCSKELQEKLIPAREKFKQWEDECVQKAQAVSQSDESSLLLLPIYNWQKSIQKCQQSTCAVLYSVAIFLKLSICKIL